MKLLKESELPSEIENEYKDAKKYTGFMSGVAFTALESAMQWCEQPECNTTKLLLFKIIKD